MASGNTLAVFTARDNETPLSAYAQLDYRNGHWVLDFDASTEESAMFASVLSRSYAGGGITVYIHWAATSAVSGDVIWAVQFERIGEGQQDIDSDGFATAGTVTATAPGTSGHLDIASIAFTDGPSIDSLAVGEGFRLKVYRDADAGGDTMAGDAELRFVELKET